jgi:crotonobetainyl-CoA:carnitine CoA-transferase CaiB-like acyl-CoA transferase
VSTPGGQEVLYEIAKTADVFLTNYMPAQRQKNKFDIEHIRAVNPNIIYARGSAYGDKGQERDTGGFDGTAFWTRSGVGHALTPEELGGALSQGIPAFGDSIGGMNIAGGISAALFHRERTGPEASGISERVVSPSTLNTEPPGRSKLPATILTASIRYMVSVAWRPTLVPKRP